MSGFAVDWGEFSRVGGGVVSDYAAVIRHSHYPHPQCLRRADATLGSWFRRVRMRLSSSILRISAVISISTVRSEERRVGKACRARWRAEHCSEKTCAKIDSQRG